MSVVKRFFGDTMIYGMSTIISRMLNFLLTPFFVAKFPATIYGVFTNLYAYASMINALLAFGMETTYFRYLQKVEEKDKGNVFNNSFIITLITTVLFLFTVFSLSEPIGRWLDDGNEVDQYIEFVKLFAVILTADALAVIPFAKLRAEGRPIRYGLLKLINIFILVGCNLFLLYWLPLWKETNPFWSSFASGWYRSDWIGNVFISNLIASVITLVLLIPQMMRFKLKPDRTLINNMLRYSFPILIANISFIINENLDKILFPKLLLGEAGDRDLGVYGAVAKIAVFLNLFITAFRLGAEPFFFSYSKNENARKIYALIMDYFVIAMVIVMIGICANIDWLKYFIEGSSASEQAIYWSGLFIVPILLFNYVLLGIYMNLSVWYKLSDQTRYALYISGIGALCTIILNVLLIPLYSYVGAVFGTTVAYLIMVGLSYYWGQRNYPIPYNLKKILFYLITGVILSWLMFNIFDSSILIGNSIFVAFLILVFLMEKKTVLLVLRKGQ